MNMGWGREVRAPFQAVLLDDDVPGGESRGQLFLCMGGPGDSVAGAPTSIYLLGQCHLSQTVKLQTEIAYFSIDALFQFKKVVLFLRIFC